MCIGDDDITEQTSSRSDRLSLLPNELLDSIFESAYFPIPPKGPISKHLYPFFEEHFYRRVHLSSSRQVDLFLRTISNQAERGKIVKSLEFSRKKERVVKSFDILEALFPLLPNLLHLDINAGSVRAGDRSKTLFQTLANVQSVSVMAKEGDSYVDLSQLAFLSALPSLSNLSIHEWPAVEGAYSEEEEAFHLSRVATLRIEGRGAEDHSIKPLIALCPALERLDLTTTWSEGTSFWDGIGGSSLILKSTLRSLKLRSTYPCITPHDTLLLQFRQFRTLNLGRGCYGSKIHEILVQSPLLVDVRLGRGTISPVDFLSLVSGSTRLVDLKRLTLDFSAGWTGQRTRHGSQFNDSSNDDMEDWGLFDDHEGGEGEQTDYGVELIELIQVAEGNGIRIRGSVHEALAHLRDYWIEANNRAVLNLYSNKDLSELGSLDYARGRAAAFGVPLPPLDLDSLDLTRLELVQIDLPERNWFIYSLKNGGRGVSDE